MDYEYDWNYRRYGRRSRAVKRKNDRYSNCGKSRNEVCKRKLERTDCKVNAGICTQILADEFQVEAVINTGIAGSLKAEINIGDIVLSTDTMQHDVDAREFGYPLGQIPRMETLTFLADEKLRKLAKEVCEEVNPDIQVFEGRVASGDQFVADKETKEKIIENTQAYCTEMEGAAIGQAAYLNKIPYLVIRAISDKADDSAHVDYPTFERQAIRHTVNLVSSMMERL